MRRRTWHSGLHCLCHIRRLSIRPKQTNSHCRREENTSGHQTQTQAKPRFHSLCPCPGIPRRPARHPHQCHCPARDRGFAHQPPNLSLQPCPSSPTMNVRPPLCHPSPLLALICSLGGAEPAPVVGREPDQGGAAGGRVEAAAADCEGCARECSVICCSCGECGAGGGGGIGGIDADADIFVGCVE